MTTDTDPTSLVGTTATDSSGDVLGTVSAVWVDDATGRPSWIGLTEGTHAVPGGDDPVLVAPLDGARTSADRVQLAVPGGLTRQAPRLAGTQRLTPEDELRLRAHYRSDPASGPTSAGDSMVRSEERLTVESVTEPWGRAVLRVETVTEEVMVPVTVTRQRARVEHRPLTPTAGGTRGALPPAEGQVGDWVTLWGEQPVVTVERLPLERVRLRTEWVTTTDTVTEQLAREELTVDTTGDVQPPS